MAGPVKFAGSPIAHRAFEAVRPAAGKICIRMGSGPKRCSIHAGLVGHDPDPRFLRALWDRGRCISVGRFWAAQGAKAGANVSPGHGPLIPHTDWQALGHAGDQSAFLDAIEGFVKASKTAIVQQIDAGSKAAQLLSWHEAQLSPALARLDAAHAGIEFTEPARMRNHDLAKDWSDLFRILLPSLLEEGNLDMIRAICQPPEGNLHAIERKLNALVAGRGQLRDNPQLWKVRLAGTVPLEEVWEILKNLVINSVEHPSAGKAVTGIQIELIGNKLRVSDSGAGMDAAAVAAIRAGVRIHDGAPVEEGNRHGLGWASIRERCKKLGIEWEIESTPGQGTGVSLILPPNFLDLEPVLFKCNTTDFLWEVTNLISRLTLEGQLTFVTKIFDAADAAKEKWQSDIRNAVNCDGDLNFIMTLANESRDWFDQVFDALRAHMPPEFRNFLYALQSSCMYIHVGMRNGTDEVMRLKREYPDEWKEKIKWEKVIPPIYTRPLAGPHGYRVSHGRREVADFAMTRLGWLGRYWDSPVSAAWENDVLVITGGKAPSLDDLRFQTWLRILGWTMQVEQRDDTVIVRLDFGKMRM